MNKTNYTNMIKKNKTGANYQEALDMGYGSYWADAPCKECGCVVFQTSKRYCRDCDKTRQAEYREQRRVTGQKIAAERREEHLRLREACGVTLTPWRDAMRNVRYESFPDTFPYNACSRPPLGHSRLPSASSAYSASMS